MFFNRLDPPAAVHDELSASALSLAWALRMCLSSSQPKKREMTNPRSRL